MERRRVKGWVRDREGTWAVAVAEAGVQAEEEFFKVTKNLTKKKLP